ncbi:MAG: ATP-binding protein, partial [Candidatus Krumholzibacteria bacterium]|nr:ATP-binding protein [Candidatus Krumholzibacteria bacterium]
HAGSSGSNLPHPFQAFVSDQPLQQLLGEVGPVKARRESTAPDGIAFFDAENRSHQFALWGRFLFVRQNDPAFIEQAKRLLDGRQIFAQLRLTQSTLSRSFFLPFVIVYGIILALSLGLALFMSERLSRPIRQLAAGADVVARGDWTYRLKIRTGGEVGQLVEAFNGMVSRLDRQKRRLVDMERMAAWRDVARHLAHEIKNPLLPIRLTMQELRDQYRGEDPRYEEILDESTRVVGDELHHLTKLVKEFSSFARMPDIEPRCGSLEPLVRDVAKLYPQLSVVVHSAPGLPEFPFDADQMRGVLVNLFDNAASVLPDPAEGEIRIIMGRQDEELLVTFSDNGPGIAHEHLPRIFDPYFTTREEGTGLGLAMVKNVVLLHGGAIDVKSTLGQGTTFTIALPLSGPGAIKNLSRRNQHDGSCSDHR